MQAVILVAGAGTRMRHLTENTPKPLVEVCGKPILDHIIEVLPKEIDEVILVVNYLADKIETHCGETYMGKKIRCVYQDNPKGGTGAALLCAKDLIRERFLFLYGDDIHGAEALVKLMDHDHAMLATESDTPEKFGVVIQNDDGTLCGVIEKPADPPSNLVNISGWVLQPSIFSYNANPHPELGEILVTDMITAYAIDNPVVIVRQDKWLPIGSPEQLAEAEAVLCPKAAADAVE